jgi:hypothetical protein
MGTIARGQTRSEAEAIRLRLADSCEAFVEVDESLRGSYPEEEPPPPAHASSGAAVPPAGATMSAAALFSDLLRRSRSSDGDDVVRDAGGGGGGGGVGQGRALHLSRLPGSGEGGGGGGRHSLFSMSLGSLALDAALGGDSEEFAARLRDSEEFAARLAFEATRGGLGGLGGERHPLDLLLHSLEERAALNSSMSMRLRAHYLTSEEYTSSSLEADLHMLGEANVIGLFKETTGGDEGTDILGRAPPPLSRTDRFLHSSRLAGGGRKRSVKEWCECGKRLLRQCYRQHGVGGGSSAAQRSSPSSRLTGSVLPKPGGSGSGMKNIPVALLELNLPKRVLDKLVRCRGGGDTCKSAAVVSSKVTRVLLEMAPVVVHTSHFVIQYLSQMSAGSGTGENVSGCIDIDDVKGTTAENVDGAASQRTVFVSSLLDFLTLVLHHSVWWTHDSSTSSGGSSERQNSSSVGYPDDGGDESNSDDSGDDDREEDDDEDYLPRRHAQSRFDNRHRPQSSFKTSGKNNDKMLEVLAQRAVIPTLAVLMQRTSPSFKMAFLQSQKTVAMTTLETLVTLGPPEWHFYAFILAHQFLAACPSQCEQFQRYGILHFVQRIHDSVGNMKSLLKWRATSAAGTTTSTSSSPGLNDNIDVGDIVRMKAGVSPCLGYGVVFPESTGVVMATTPLQQQQDDEGLVGHSAITVSFPEQHMWCGFSDEVEVVNHHRSRDYIPGISIGAGSLPANQSLSKLHFNAAGQLLLGCERTDVTEKLEVGARVRRGPDWNPMYGNQDGGEGGLGTVVKSPCQAGWTKIEWDATGVSNSYRWNADGFVFDIERARTEATTTTTPKSQRAHHRLSSSRSGIDSAVGSAAGAAATAVSSVDFFSSSFAESIEDWTAGCGTLVPVQMIQTSAGWTNAVWGWTEGLNNHLSVASGKESKKMTSSDEIQPGPQVVSLKEGSSFERMNALANVVFLSGKHVWEVCIDKDNGAGTCVGATTTPFEIKGAHGYEKSNSCWLYRSHRGQLYNRGHESRSEPFAPFFEGPQSGHTSVVQFYLDLDAKTISITTNGKDQGVAFTNVTAPVIPMVHVYGTGSKSVRIQNVFTFTGERVVLPLIVSDEAQVLDVRQKKGVGTPVSVRLNDSYLQYRSAVITKQYYDDRPRPQIIAVAAEAIADAAVASSSRNARHAASSTDAVGASVVPEPFAYDVQFLDGTTEKVAATAVEFINGIIKKDRDDSVLRVNDTTMHASSDTIPSKSAAAAATFESAFFFVGDQVRLKRDVYPCGGYGGVPVPEECSMEDDEEDGGVGTIVQIVAHAPSGEAPPPRRKMVWVNFPRHKGFICLHEELVLHQRGHKSQVIMHVFEIDHAITNCVQQIRQVRGNMQSLGRAFVELFKAERVLTRAHPEQQHNVTLRDGKVRKEDLLQFDNSTLSGPRVKNRGLLFGDDFAQAIQYVQQLMSLLQDRDITLFEFCSHSMDFLLHGLLFASNDEQSNTLVRAMTAHDEAQHANKGVVLDSSGVVVVTPAHHHHHHSDKESSSSGGGSMDLLLQFLYRLFMAEEKLPIFSFKAKGFENLKSLSSPLLITLKPHPASMLCLSPIHMLSNKVTGTNAADTSGNTTLSDGNVLKDGKRTCEGVHKGSKWGGGGPHSSSSPCDCILVVSGLPSVHGSLQPLLEQLLYDMFSEIGKLDTLRGGIASSAGGSGDSSHSKSLKKMKKGFQTLNLSETDPDPRSPQNKRAKVDGFSMEGESESTAEDDDGALPVCVPINKTTQMTLRHAYVQFGNTFDAALASQIADGFNFASFRLSCTRFSSLLQQQLYVNPLMPIEKVQQHILRTVQASNQQYMNFCLSLEGARVQERKRTHQGVSSGKDISRISCTDNSGGDRHDDENENPLFQEAMVKQWYPSNGAHLLEYANGKRKKVILAARDVRVVKGTRSNVVVQCSTERTHHQMATEGDVSMEGSSCESGDSTATNNPAWLEDGGAEMLRIFSELVTNHPCMNDHKNQKRGSKKHNEKKKPRELQTKVDRCVFEGATSSKSPPELKSKGDSSLHVDRTDTSKGKGYDTWGDRNDTSKGKGRGSSWGHRKDKSKGKGTNYFGNRSDKSKGKGKGAAGTQTRDDDDRQSSQEKEKMQSEDRGTTAPTKAERRNEVQHGLNELGTRVYLPPTSSSISDDAGIPRSAQRRNSRKADRVLGRPDGSASSYRHHHQYRSTTEGEAREIATIYHRFPDNTWGVVLDDGEVLDHVVIDSHKSGSHYDPPHGQTGGGVHRAHVSSRTISHPSSRSAGEVWLRREAGDVQPIAAAVVKNSDSALGLTRDWSALSPSQTNSPDHIQGGIVNRRVSVVSDAAKMKLSRNFEIPPCLRVGLSLQGEESVLFLEDSQDRVSQTRVTTVFQFLQLLQNRSESSSEDHHHTGTSDVSEGHTLFYDIDVDFVEPQPSSSLRLASGSGRNASTGSKAAHGHGGGLRSSSTCAPVVGISSSRRSVSASEDEDDDDEEEASAFHSFPERLVECRTWDDKDVLLQIEDCVVGRSSALVLQLLAKLNSLDTDAARHSVPPQAGISTQAASRSLHKPSQICSSLSKKLVQQLDDPMAIVSGALPKWCHSLCTLIPSLFDLKARTQLFLSTAFGVSRAVHWIQQKAEAFVRSRYTAAESAAVLCPDPSKATRLWADVDRLEQMRDRVRKNNIGDLQVTIAKIDRAHLLRDTEHIMQKFRSGVHKNGRLEVQFVGDTGFDNNAYEAGVTQGFYSIVAKQLKKRVENKLAPLWADGLLEDLPLHDGCVYSAQGVRPLPSTFDPQVLEQLGLVEEQSLCDEGSSDDISMEKNDAKEAELYPRPFSADQSRQILKRWEMMGHISAVAMRDQFRFPISFSLSTLKLLQGYKLSRETDLPPIGELGGEVSGLLPVCKKLNELDQQVKSGDMLLAEKERQVLPSIFHPFFSL